jgi:hypothetical protein
VLITVSSDAQAALVFDRRPGGCLFELEVNIMRAFRTSSMLLILFAITTMPFATQTKAQCVTAPTGLTNWWPADGNAFDIIGGEHGTLQGGATFDAGEVVQAFSLDGVNDYVLVPNDPAASFNFAGSFSIDAWINLKSAPPEFAPIVSKWNDIPFGNDQRSYFLAVQPFGGALRVRFDVSADGQFLGGHSSARVSADTIPLNTWTHVAATFDGPTHTLTIYVNGHPSVFAFVDSNVTAPFVNNEPVLIGAGDLGSNIRDFFDGRIDEVELFNRALSQTEIQSIVNAGTSGKTIPIDIDIKPEGKPNSINLGSKGNVPVAILSTETFDATTVDVSSLKFAGAPVQKRKNGTFMASFEDVNGDGRPDLVLHFETQALGLTSASTEATLTGLTNTGRCVSGTDSVNIVP